MPRSRSFLRRSLQLAVLLGSAVASPAAGTQTSRAIACQTIKLLAAGAEAYGGIVCARRTDSSGCRRAFGDRRASVFRRVESRGGCTTNGDSAKIGDEVAELVDELAVSLAPSGAGGSRCVARQLSASARATVHYARAKGADKRSPNPTRLAGSIEALRAQLATAFAAAASHGDCLSATTSEQVFGILLDRLGRLVPELFPEPCPCFSSEDIDAAFGRGYLDREQRGGAACVNVADAVAIGTADGCVYQPPIGAIVVSLPRAAAFTSDGICFLTNDLDPDDDGRCGGIPNLVQITPEQKVGCAAAIAGSMVYRRECE